VKYDYLPSGQSQNAFNTESTEGTEKTGEEWFLLVSSVPSVLSFRPFAADRIASHR